MKQLRLLTIVFMLLMFFPIVLAHHEPEHTQCPPGECPRDVDSFVEEVINTKLTNAGIISLAFLVIGTVALAFKGLKKKKKNIVALIINIIILALFILMGYSYYYFNTTASETTGIVVCEAGECFWAAHIHSLLYIDICGEQIELGLEEGLLEGTHTHKEKNKLHFHERLTVDPETREVTDFTPLEMETSLNDFGIETSDGCIVGTCNGDMCNGNEGRWGFSFKGSTKVLNNEEVEYWQDYAWKDEDILTISFK